MAQHVYVITLGCPKNLVDTEAALGMLLHAGFQATDNLAQADCVLINTCGFLQSSVDEAHAEIDAMAREKAAHHYRLVVTGCLVQRHGEALRAQFPAIDAIVGVHNYDELLQAVTGGTSIALHERNGQYEPSFYLGRALATGPGWAYLRIADGCDNRCAYCTIPDIRGHLRSRPQDEILLEAEILTERGINELNLIAQDVTRYGFDLGDGSTLAGLLRRLNAMDVAWIRLLYTHPAHYTDELITVLAESERVVKYLDIPLQHVADRLLAAMNRRITGAATRALLRTLRERIPGLTLRTTLIVGLPGETDEEFDELLDFVTEFRFEHLGAFRYSPEPDTPAAVMPDQVSDDVKQERYDRLMRRQQQIALAYNRELKGSTVDVLVEGPLNPRHAMARKHNYTYSGRSAADAPEIDRTTYFTAPRSARITPGQIVRVRIDAAWEYDLGGWMV